MGKREDGQSIWSLKNNSWNFFAWNLLMRNAMRLRHHDDLFERPRGVGKCDDCLGRLQPSKATIRLVIESPPGIAKGPWTGDLSRT